VLALLYLSLKDTSSLRFVESCDFQDLGRVEPRVGAPTHDSDALAHPARVTIYEVTSYEVHRATYISYTGIPLYVAWDDGAQGWDGVSTERLSDGNGWHLKYLTVRHDGCR
jgi:hypothetical protein